MVIPDQNLNNLCLEFKKLWVASAFRGAHTPSKTLPDLHNRLQNHKNWLDKLEGKLDSIQGIVVTGWSRFTHFTVLCELLPSSIPSLVLCLSVLERRKLSLRALYSNVVKILFLQARMLLQSVDTIYKECEGDLKRFASSTP